MGSSPVAALVDWLRARTDDELTQLLQHRPDLGLPAPPDLVALANRLGIRTSVQRAVDGLDAYTLHVLEALVLSADGAESLAVSAAGEWLGRLDPAPALHSLRLSGLVWGPDDALVLVTSVAESLGQYPAGLGRPAARLFASVPDLTIAPVLRGLGLAAASQPGAGVAVAQALADVGVVQRLLADCDDDERAVLDRLALGPPIGTYRPGRGDADDPVARLLRAGLLAPLDAQTVELPREIGLALRPHPLGRAVTATAPVIQVTTHDPADLDRTGAITVLETVRLVTTLAESWTLHPPTQLRAGGLGVRDLRRTARDLDLDEATTAVLVETATAAGLFAPTSGIEPVYLPTTDYDIWAARDPARQWTDLAQAWLVMSRQPNLVNERGERDRLITALGPDTERGTVAALRARLLDVLAALDSGSAPINPEAVLERWAWSAPRRARSQRPTAAAILAEAGQLGITARGGLTGYTRTLRAGNIAVAEQVLAAALPTPVDEFLVQPDLTIVVPGPPTRELADDLSLIADLESSGGASVYRVTEASVRRALDAGRAGPALLRMLRERSRTPIPQALEYLVSDGARRHGVLRTGVAAAYLRCNDEALLDRVLADRNVGALALQRIAPTVAISFTPVAELLTVLRAAGFAPAAEGHDGGLLSLTADSPRAPARPRPRVYPGRTTEPPAAAQLRLLVKRIRAGDALTELARDAQPVSPGVTGVTSATTMGVLRAAIREGHTVWLGVVETDGSQSRHMMVPISMGGGFVRGHEDGAPGLRSYPLHRLSAVHVLAEPDADPA